MKKLLLNLTLLLAGVVSAQEGLPTPSYAAHFTGHIAGGRMGTAAAPQSTNATLVADRHNNLNDAISNVSGSSYITLPGAANSMTSNFSISFWYKKTGTFQGNLNHRPFFTAPNTATIGYGEGTFLGLNNDGTKFVFGNVINTPITGSQSKEVNIPANVNVEEWNYYTLIRENATTLALYVNNVFLDNKENITFSSINGNGNIYLGGYSLGSSFASCQGHFDNLKIYHNPLSETQRTALYNWEMGDSYRGEIKVLLVNLS
ncbi:MAG: LamG domain-containing protein, partial [Flavobacterium sp.]